MESKTSQINFFVCTLTRQNYSAVDIHSLLHNSWGNSIGVRRIQKIAKAYKSGEKNSFKRNVGSGRPISSSNIENVERIRQFVEQNCKLSCSHISAFTGIPARTVNHILTTKLHKKCLHARWIPHVLTEAIKNNRVVCAENLIDILNKRVSRRVVVIDEKWIFYRCVPPIMQQCAWVDNACNRPQVARKTIADRKAMVLFSCNFQGEAYFEILDIGKSVNSQRYLEFLQRMCGFYSNIHPPLTTENILLMHDNATPHKAAIVSNWIRLRNITSIRQAPYSPDMNLLDRYVFRNYETHRKNQHFQHNQQLTESLEGFIAQFTRDKFKKQQEKLIHDCRKIIDKGGNYL